MLSAGADRLVRAIKAGNAAGAKGLHFAPNWKQEEAYECSKTRQGCLMGAV